MEQPVEISPRPSPAQAGEMVLRFATQEGTTDQPEIFDTIQGEGRNIGTPVVFARLSGCNLQCSWCDTPYTWAFTEAMAERHDEGKVYDRQAEQVRLEVGEAVEQIGGYQIKRLVITGGEPMLQQKGIVELVKGLKEETEDYWVEVETNGTIAPSEEMTEVIDQFNVSPKLANSGNELEKRRKDPAMEAFAKNPKADFKFVSTGEADIMEILELTDRYDIPAHRVYLMPEGRTPEEVEEHQRGLVEIAKVLNFNVTTRLHVLIWGAKRGV